MTMFRASPMLAILLAGGVPTMAQDQSDMQRALEAADKLAVIETVNAIGINADLDRWDLVIESFSPGGVILDYSSYATASAGTEEEPQAQPREDIVAAWRTVLPGYDYTQHVMGNHQVSIDGNAATSISTVHATHILANDQGEDFWIFIGDYEHHLVRTPQGWKVDRMTANMRAELGNADLPKLATQRVKDGEGRKPR